MQRFTSAAQLADALEADRADRIRAQARAEYLQHQTESILSSAAEGIFSQNLDGICLLVNPAVSEVTGFSLEQLRGSQIHDLLHHSHPDGTPYAFDECPISNAQRSAESVHSVADVFWRKDGSSARSVDDLVPPRVLVVEDDPGLAGILTEGLAASGVETQHATNSERAIALTSTGNPDLLLVNVAPAADSGLQVVDWLRERDQLRRVPVVIYSGRDLSKPEAVHERVMTLLSHFA